MHRVHHSVLAQETNSNFGFNLPWWDFLFGTYKAQPKDGHESMTIGLSQFREVWVNRLHWMLALPFFGSTGTYPVNRSTPAVDDAHGSHTDESKPINNKSNENLMVSTRGGA